MKNKVIQEKEGFKIYSDLTYWGKRKAELALKIKQDEDKKIMSINKESKTVCIK